METCKHMGVNKHGLVVVGTCSSKPVGVGTCNSKPVVAGVVICRRKWERVEVGTCRHKGDAQAWSCGILRRESLEHRQKAWRRAQPRTCPWISP